LTYDIVYVDRNGAKKSGLFCGINLMFERMQRDHEVDVFQTLKTIRVNRPQFIEDIVSYLGNDPR
jgi:hypothetical protein